MSSDPAIRCDGLGKAYMIRHQQSDHVTLAEVALSRLRHPLTRQRRERFWALRDVSFEVSPGEVLGIIGRNGAGKSTLLKLLTRITAPSTGHVDLWGRVGSLLEVGTGFHPELTGRENVYLNGSILGMSRREIDRQFDAIVDFAGVARFLDTPVKRYSSGMYVRLAFAVAAHLETEILLVDEVLAVGDQEFQKKCLDKMHDVAVDGRTVLFVSHQLQSVSTLCDRVLRLDGGTLHSQGPASTMVPTYLRDLAATQVEDVPERRRSSGWGLDDVRLEHGSVLVGDPLRVRIEATTDHRAPLALFPSVSVVAIASGEVVAHCDGRRVDATVDVRDVDACSWDFELRSPWLRSGEYALSVHLCTVGEVLDSLDPARLFTVLPETRVPGLRTLEFSEATTTVADFAMVPDRAVPRAARPAVEHDAR